MTTPATAPQIGAHLGMKSGLTLALDVSNYERSKKWYQEVLGMKFVYEIMEYGWCELETPTRDVVVGISQVEEVKVSGGLVPVFATGNIEHTRAKLEAHGVTFDGPTRELPGLVKLATFFDPDGHPFMLSESLGQPG
jgi:predicted enzyme related to lactoylglutathione lyase